MKAANSLIAGLLMLVLGATGCAVMHTENGMVIRPKYHVDEDRSRLRKGEYTIPADVMEVFGRLVYGVGEHAYNDRVMALYVNTKSLMMHRERFLGELEGLGYPEEEADGYYRVLSGKGNVVIKDYALGSSMFDDILKDERTHRAFDKLDLYDQALVLYAYHDLKKRGSGDESFFRERPGYGGATERTEHDFNNFMPYLVMGAFDDSVYRALEEFPEAWKIYQGIKQQVELDL